MLGFASATKKEQSLQPSCSNVIDAVPGKAMKRHSSFQDAFCQAIEPDGSRHAAAQCLANQLKAQAQTEPNKKHVVIAHSHGGNIALRASADPQLAPHLSSIVCMSTPIFAPEKRD
jgi:hypothetical protein